MRIAGSHRQNLALPIGLSYQRPLLFTHGYGATVMVGEAGPGEGRSPTIHVFNLLPSAKTWMAGTSPAMTGKRGP